MTETVFSDEQKAQAESMRAELAELLKSVREQKTATETSFVAIGQRLANIRTRLYWKLWGFANWTEFMESIDSRTQCYHAFGVARDLLAHVSETDLLAIGITKAALLRTLIKGGKFPTPEIIALAKEKSKDELEDKIHTELGIVEDEEPGDWFSYGGARLNEEEKKEFLLTANAAIRAAGIDNEEITKWQDVPSIVKKLIMRALCAEFLSSYAQYMAA
jgi:hypothetical protein